MTEGSGTGLKPCLITIDTDSKAEEHLYYQQRVVCGWRHDAVPQVFDQARNKRRTLYWVCIPSDSDAKVSKDGIIVLSDWYKDPASISKIEHIHLPLLQDPRADLSPEEQKKKGFLPVGHISIDFEDFGAKITPLLGSSDGRIMTISSLFVLPCYRELGLANWAMKECERLIRSGSTHEVKEGGNMVKCEIIALSSMSARHWNMPGPDGMGRWERMGLQPGRYLGNWYRSLGYEWVAEMEKYKVIAPDGEELYWWCEIWHKKV